MINNLPNNRVASNVCDPLLLFTSTAFRAAPGFAGKIKAAAGILLAIFCLELQAQTIRYVKPGGSGNGSSWAQAYGDLQQAINASSSNNVIFVAAGTYKPRRPANNLGTARLDGFTVQGGNANSDGCLSNMNGQFVCRYLGGGMYNVSSSPTIANCTFENNAGRAGGGMYNLSSSPEIINCVFAENATTSEGGGMLNDLSPSLTIANCIFKNNTANTGGGMYNYSSSPKIINCTFCGNNAEINGGGMNNNGSSNPAITNCIFVNNRGGTGGGAMFNGSSSPTIVGTTFSKNTGFGGTVSIFYNILSSPVIRNCILYGNTTNLGIRNSQSTPEFSYNIIQGSGGSAKWNSGLGLDEGGNIDADPLFADPDNGDYTLLPCSPAINAGSNALIPTGIITDLSGAPRTQFDVVDMGAYEAGSMFEAGTAQIVAGTTEATAWKPGDSQTFYITKCDLVAGLAGDGSETSVSGEVSVKVWVQTTQPTSYVKRHYEIMPEDNPSTSTGIVTLYFTQQEFNDFNAANSPNYPKGLTTPKAKPTCVSKSGEARAAMVPALRRAIPAMLPRSLLTRLPGM